LICFSTRSAVSSFIPFWISLSGTSSSSLSRKRLIEVMNSPTEAEIFLACWNSPLERPANSLYFYFVYSSCASMARDRSNSPAISRNYPSSTGSPSLSLRDCESKRKIVSTKR
jgi:hypothetical protein